MEAERQGSGITRAAPALRLVKSEFHVFIARYVAFCSKPIIHSNFVYSEYIIVTEVHTKNTNVLLTYTVYTNNHELITKIQIYMHTLGILCTY